MSCNIPSEFPLLPFEPVPRGETLAHWRNEIAAMWTSSRVEWCAAGEIDLSGIEASIAALVAASGEANTASNVGSVGTGVFKQKSGFDLEFYKLNSADNKLAIALIGTDRIDFTINANNVVAASTDPRLSDARVPLAHAASHFSAGSDPIRIDQLKIGTDVTTLNATATEHGLLRKLSGTATEFLNGAGAWATPVGLTPGTANYLPKWTAAAPYLSATSLVYDNGTYVGVGVGAAPLSALHVASNTAAGVTGSNIQLRLSDSINTAKCLLIGWDTVNQAGYIQATEVGVSANLIQLNPSGGNVSVGAGFIIPLTGYLYGNGAGIVTASASVPFGSVTGTVGIAQGGTGQITAILGFNALSPLTTRGDLLTRDATNNIRLAIGIVGKYLRTDGTDPGWSVLLASDLSGQVSVASGGTGAATLTGILQGNGVAAVTGITGTANYIPKWSATAPYLTGTSLIYDDGTNVGIGTASPNQQLEITKNFRLPPSTATTGIIYSGVDRFIHNFAAVGSDSKNTFVGLLAGNFTMSPGGGASSLASYNSIVGASAFIANTTGQYNSAIGVFGLGSNTTGSQNMAVGYSSLFGNLTGSRNVGIGYLSGFGVTGSGNVLIGASSVAASFNQVTTGSRNISIGDNVAVASATASDQLSIGNMIYGTGLIGTGATVSTGKIGIGTTAPDRALEVNSATGINLRLTYNDTNGSAATFADLLVSSAGLLTLEPSSNQVAIPAGASISYVKLGGNLADYSADVSVGGAETDIFTATTAASILGTNNDKLIAEYGGNFVTVGTELTQLKVYFAGTAIWDSTGVAPSTGTTSWRVYVEIIRVSASVVRFSVSLNTTGATGYVYCTVGELTGLTLSNTNILKLTGVSSGVGSGSGDIIGKMGYIQWLSSAS